MTRKIFLVITCLGFLYSFMAVPVQAASPIIDGVKEAAWGTPVAEDPAGDMSEPNLDLQGLYVTDDTENYYIGFDASASTWGMAYGIYIDTDQTDGSGGTSDPWTRAISAVSLHLPEYTLYVWHDSMDTLQDVQLNQWDGSSWTYNTLFSHGGEQAYGPVNDWIEYRVPKTALGNTTNISLELFSTGGSGHAQDSVPSDPNVNYTAPDWGGDVTILSTWVNYTAMTGAEPEKIGIYNGGNWYIDANGDGQFTGEDRYIPYGAPNWTGLVGDWNGDGDSEIGIYQDATWYLDYGGSGVIDADTKYYTFGAPGWTAITGDWNADMKDEVGVYQDGNWYLDYNGNGYWDAEDKNYGFGAPGWTPVIGKWTIDGRDKIGIYNGGNWYIDVNGDGQFTGEDRYIPYGAPNWTGLVGDWNGDGVSEIGINKDTEWYLDYGGSGVIDADTKYYTFGAPGWISITGDWDADTKDEIGVYQNGNWYLDFNGNGYWDVEDKNYGFGAPGWTAILGKWDY